MPVKISGLPSVANANLSDFFPVVQSGVTSKETNQQLLNLLQPNIPLTSNGNPNGILAGSSYQLAWDSLGEALYVCTVTGTSSSAVWTIVGATSFNVQPAVAAASTASLTVSYVNGTAGIGATLTNAGTQAALVIDNYTAALGDRILIKNQASAFQNGIYTVTNLGSISTNWILTRATDFDTPEQIVPGAFVVVENGTINATTSWIQTANVTTVGTSSISFSQLSANPALFLRVANNLSDLASASAALVNIGLGVPTGTGNVVLSNSPTLITPILGAANATNLTFTSTSGIIGSITNDNAAAGSVGEEMQNIVTYASRIGLTSNSNANLVSLSLTAGDWDIWGNAFFTNSGAYIQSASLGFNTVSATIPDPSVASGVTLSGAPTSEISQIAPGIRISLASTTTVYLVVVSTFTTATTYVCGGMYARRRR